MIPGVTRRRLYQLVSQKALAHQLTYALLVLVDVGGSHGEVARIGGPPQGQTQIVEDEQRVSISEDAALYWELQKATKVVLYTYSM